MTTVHACSALISREENEIVFQVLGPRRKSLATTVAQVFHALPPGAAKWTKFQSGVVCFVKDSTQRSYFIRVVDIEIKSVVFDQELYDSFVYKRTQPFFHTFAGDDFMVGLNFANFDEAKNFGDAVDKKVSFTRQMTLGRKKEPSDGHGTIGTIDRRQVNLSTDRPAAVRTPDRRQVNISTDRPQVVRIIDQRQGNISTDTLVVVPSQHKGKSAKPKKKKVSLKDIGRPVEFRHIAHAGWDPDGGFSTANIDSEWTKLFETVGITEEQLQDRDTANFIYDFVENYGDAGPSRTPTRRRGPSAGSDPPRGASDTSRSDEDVCTLKRKPSAPTLASSRSPIISRRVAPHNLGGATLPRTSKRKEISRSDTARRGPPPPPPPRTSSRRQPPPPPSLQGVPGEPCKRRPPLAGVFNPPPNVRYTGQGTGMNGTEPSVVPTPPPPPPMGGLPGQGTDRIKTESPVVPTPPPPPPIGGLQGQEMVGIGSPPGVSTQPHTVPFLPPPSRKAGPRWTTKSGSDKGRVSLPPSVPAPPPPPPIPQGPGAGPGWLEGNKVPPPPPPQSDKPRVSDLGTNSRGNLLASIRQGTKLRTAGNVPPEQPSNNLGRAKNPPPPPPQSAKPRLCDLGANPRDNLLESIRQGAKLRKVDDIPPVQPACKVTNLDGLAGALARALQQRSKALEDDDSEVDVSDDEDWD